jgi:hypothetical protein
VPLSVPALIQVEEDDGLYLNSNQAAPEIAGQVIVADVPVNEAAVNTGGNSQLIGVAVLIVTTDVHALAALFVQNVRALKS